MSGKNPKTSSVSPAISDSVQFLKGVGPARAKQLERLGIVTVRDLLHYYPRRYEDRSTLRPISLSGFSDVETIRGTVISVTESHVRKNLSILKVVLGDTTGTITCVWFNQPYLKQRFRLGTDLILSGRVERKFGRLQIESPEFEELDSADEENVHTARIVPIYGLTQGLFQKTIRSICKSAVDKFASLEPEFLDPALLKKHNLMPLGEALRQIHFPDSFEMLELARRRLVWNELFMIQVGLQLQKQSRSIEAKRHRHKPDGPLLFRFVQSLPFSLTRAQQRAWSEIGGDMELAKPMSRLLQGDVGSGKTVVAAMAVLKSVESGHQAALMAPTEILAEQHFINLGRMLGEQGVRVALLTSGLAKKQRELILSALPAGEIDVIIGTHALIEQAVEFRSLGLVVVDEQHRFGVRQRALLVGKGGHPDVLIMTATPIPRTLALTLYGDLDYSVIDEMPPGRKPVITQVIPADKKRKAYAFAREQVLSGNQVYVVCPLIEESENLQAEAALALRERLSRQTFRGMEVGLLHGRLSTDEKEAAMRGFREGRTSVMVSTTVIEVGVDVPGATVMIIEGADRFGLAQLHQLRGRVGRGREQSFCFLICSGTSADARRRMEVMEATNDGFKIAEADLEIRGPGEFFGTRQHGLPDLKIANPLKDQDILVEARDEALLLLESDPRLQSHQNQPLLGHVMKAWPKGMGLATIS